VSVSLRTVRGPAQLAIDRLAAAKRLMRVAAEVNALELSEPEELRQLRLRIDELLGRLSELDRQITHARRSAQARPVSGNKAGHGRRTLEQVLAQIGRGR
jgi:hypothetical protein